MNPLKTESLVERDAACLGGGNESKVPDEEHLFLKDSFGQDSVQFLFEAGRDRKSKVCCKGRRADCGTIVKLHFAGLSREARTWRRRCRSAIASRNETCFHGSAIPRAWDSAITSVAASSTTPNPSSSSCRRIAVLPEPGVPVRMNLFMNRFAPMSVWICPNQRSFTAGTVRLNRCAQRGHRRRNRALWRDPCVPARLQPHWPHPRPTGAMLRWPRATLAGVSPPAAISLMGLGAAKTVVRAWVQSNV